MVAGTGTSMLSTAAEVNVSHLKACKSSGPPFGQPRYCSVSDGGTDATVHSYTYTHPDFQHKDTLSLPDPPILRCPPPSTESPTGEPAKHVVTLDSFIVPQPAISGCLAHSVSDRRSVAESLSDSAIIMSRVDNFSDVDDADYNQPFPGSHNTRNQSKFFRMSTIGPYIPQEFDDASPASELEDFAAYGEESTCSYMLSLFQYFWNTSTVRGKQARLTFMETLEHFDMLNDLVFICRILLAIRKSRIDDKSDVGRFVVSWLGCIYVTSLLGYLLRRKLVYHRITDEHLKLFQPIAVFKQIREAGKTHPEVLYMFERLSWTYQLIQRVIEDVPQVVLSSMFILHFGKDLFAILMIMYSFGMLIGTTIRMGLRYPLMGTVSLLLSSEPPIDSAVAQEAAPTTYHVTLFMSFTCAVWTAAHIFTYRFAHSVWKPFIVLANVITVGMSLSFLWLWFYYRGQSATDVDQAFMRGTSQIYITPKITSDQAVSDRSVLQTSIS